MSEAYEIAAYMWKLRTEAQRDLIRSWDDASRLVKAECQEAGHQMRDNITDELWDFARARINSRAA